MYNLLRLITWKLDPLKVRLATCCSCFCDHQSTRILKWIYIEYIWSVSMKFLPQFLAIFKRSEHSSSYYIKLFKAFYYHLLFPRNVLYIFILRESNSRNCKFNIVVRIFRWYFDYFDNIYFFLIHRSTRCYFQIKLYLMLLHYGLKWVFISFSKRFYAKE